MEKQRIDIENPTKVTQKRIYDLYCDHYDSIHSLFVEFEFAWFQQAYQALQDLDKYNIIIFLYKQYFTELNEIFKVKSLNEFYINSRFNLEKINIIKISKELKLSKETTRRKILELEEDGILIKDKKTITVTLKAGLLQKPETTINSFSKILEYISYFLYKDKHVEKYYQKEFFIKKIKERFTQILAIFLEFQLNYVLKRKELLNNDTEMVFIIGALFYNQVIYLKKSKKISHYKKEWEENILNIGDKKGLNAMTISDLTGIPRPTVIRKLKTLLKQKDAYKDQKNLYYMVKGKFSNSLNKQRLTTIKELSLTISRINNIIFYT
jgi:Fic family protein